MRESRNLSDPDTGTVPAMHLGVQNESSPHERRVAIPPPLIASLHDLGFDVMVESRAGAAAGFSDAQFEEAGATVVPSLADGPPVDVLVSVAPVPEDATTVVSDGGAVVGLLDPSEHPDLAPHLARRGIVAVAMELLPRSTLAQSMDALSSQATAAGYAAVLLGATSMPKFMPMFVTAAGTIPPARVLILGVGVAGLQAIATAKRLGAIVYAYDIRPETATRAASTRRPLANSGRSSPMSLRTRTWSSRRLRCPDGPHPDSSTPMW